MIGQAYTQKPSAEPRGLPFVIGAAANGRKVTRPMAEARAALAAIGAGLLTVSLPFCQLFCICKNVAFFFHFPPITCDRCLREFLLIAVS